MPIANKKNIKSVLFLCTGNLCRSVMAEYIFNDYAKKQGLNIVAASAGIHAQAGLPTTKENKEVLGQLGISDINHYSQPMSLVLFNKYDLICPLAPEHERFLTRYHSNQFLKIQSLFKLYKGPEEDIHIIGIIDPIGQDIEVYKKTLDMVQDAVKNLIKELTA